MAGFDIIENQLLGLTTSFPYINQSMVYIFFVLLVTHKDIKQEQ